MVDVAKKAFVRRRRTAAVIVLALVGAACSAYSPEPDQPQTDEQMPAGDASRGFAYASETCSSCHAIARRDSRSPRSAAPSFQALADRPDMSRIGLAVLMQTSHQEMPDLIVGSQEIADLWAYMSTLRSED
jgi:mono/diheme cytochrome c family protein